MAGFFIHIRHFPGFRTHGSLSRMMLSVAGLAAGGRNVMTVDPSADRRSVLEQKP